MSEQDRTTLRTYFSRQSGSWREKLVDTLFARATKKPVQAASAGALAAYTRDGAVITADANGALGTVDGVTLAAGDRLLLKDGAADEDNGIYEVTSLGGASAPFILTRADDLTTDDLAGGALVFCEAGTVNAGLLFCCPAAAGADVVDTDALTFVALADTTHAALADGGVEYHDTDQVENLSDVAGADLTAVLNLLGLGRYTLYMVNVTHANLTAAATSQALDLDAITGFPANARLIGAHAKLNTEFSGGGAGAVAVELGDAGAADELITSTNVFTGAGAGLKVADGALVGASQFEAAYVPLLTVTADVDVNLLTAGDIDVYIVALELQTP